MTKELKLSQGHESWQDFCQVIGAFISDILSWNDLTDLNCPCEKSKEQWQIGECPKCHKLNVEIDIMSGFWGCPDCGFAWSNPMMQSLASMSAKVTEAIQDKKDSQK